MNYIKILNVFKEHSKDYIANNFIVPTCCSRTYSSYFIAAVNKASVSWLSLFQMCRIVNILHFKIKSVDLALAI